MEGWAPDLQPDAWEPVHGTQVEAVLLFWGGSTKSRATADREPGAPREEEEEAGSYIFFPAASAPCPWASHQLRMGWRPHGSSQHFPTTA